MIDFINKTISGFFGKKSDRDIKSIDPIVTKIHESYQIIEKLSNDGLRQKSNELKAKVAAAINAEEQRVKDLKAKVETDEIADVDEKERIYVEIDALNKEISNEQWTEKHGQENKNKVRYIVVLDLEYKDE